MKFDLFLIILTPFQFTLQYSVTQAHIFIKSCEGFVEGHPKSKVKPSLPVSVSDMLVTTLNNGNQLSKNVDKLRPAIFFHVSRHKDNYDKPIT